MWVICFACFDYCIGLCYGYLFWLLSVSWLRMLYLLFWFVCLLLLPAIVLVAVVCGALFVCFLFVFVN